MGIVWLVAVVVFGVLEAVTAQFVSIWFAGGAVCSLVAYLLKADTAVQCIVFVAASAILLLFTRPAVKKLTANRTEKTNVDVLIGKSALITKPTDGMGERGEAKIDGKYWTACSSDGQPIEKDSVVTVEKIEGVKLIVRK